MKVRILVEVSERGGKARRIKQVEVSKRAVKLAEAVCPGPEVMAFIADDVMSAAMRSVEERAQPQMALDLKAKAPSVDDHGKPTGRTMLEDDLGLDVIEQMLRKDGAGAVQARPLVPGRVPGPPPVRRG